MVERPRRGLGGHGLAVEPKQLIGTHGRVVGDVERLSVDAVGAQGTQQRLTDVGVVHEMEPLVRRPLARPQERLGEMRIALAVHEREAENPQAQPFVLVQPQ
jgi:hypothetical protein